MEAKKEKGKERARLNRATASLGAEKASSYLEQVLAQWIQTLPLF